MLFTAAIFVIIVQRSLKLIHIIKFVFLGPDLPTPLFGHSMVPLGLGQAILGGSDENVVFQKKIYHVTCSNQVFDITKLRIELSVPKAFFVAIHIPDSISGCISESKLQVEKTILLFVL